MSEKKSINTTEMPEIDISVDKGEKNTKKKKKAVIIGFVIMCIIGLISFAVLYLIPETKDSNPMFDSKKQEEIIGMYGSTQTYLYYPIDPDLDVMTDKEYLDLDRNIYYTKGAETIALAEKDMASYSDDVKFFVNYFDLAIKGNYDAYNSLFTENYYKSNEEYFSFTQQMIYDMHIEKLGEGTERGLNAYYFNVSYKIHRNNGTFRNDIGSDGYKTLHFTLVKENDKILIDSIKYYTN